MTTKPTTYRLLAERFGHPAGTIVYDQLMHDYGLASDDTRHTGIEHQTVTLNVDGTWPGFTVPKGHLQRLSEQELAELAQGAATEPDWLAPESHTAAACRVDDPTCDSCQ